jgi:hypothetical protein
VISVAPLGETLVDIARSFNVAHTIMARAVAPGAEQ